MATKNTSFSESNISVSSNTSSLTINVYFSADNSSTWFNDKTLSCSCNGQTQSRIVSLSRGGSVSASFTFSNIAHNNDGSKSVGWSWSCTTGTSALGTISDSGVRALTKIARWATMTGANNFNDEQNPRMTFSNPAGTRIDVWLEPNPNSTHLCIRNNIPNTGSYTWTLTEAERNQLRSACKGNSCKVRYGLYSHLSGSVRASYRDMTMTIVNGNPTFSNFEFEDINSTTLALTGDSSININGFSTTQVTVSELDKATANKQATMKKYRYSNGNQSADIDYKNTENVVGIITSTTSGTHNIYAIDSRNNSTMVTKLSSREINYTPITLNAINCSAERDSGGVGTNCTLKLHGTFWNDTFGQVSNTLQNLTYKLKKSNSSVWINGRTTLTPTIGEDGNFSFQGLIASDNEDYSWDIDSSYNILIIAEDKLSYKETEIVLGAGKPTLSFGRNGVGILCAYDDSLGGTLQVNGEVIGENIYLTDEIKIGKWINGKPIYRKVFTDTMSSSETTKTISLNLSNVDKFVNVYPLIIRAANFSQNSNIGEYYNNSTDYFNCLMNTPNDKTVRVRGGDNWPKRPYDFAVIVEYTKTTD